MLETLDGKNVTKIPHKEDERVTQPLLDLASEIGVQVVHVPTMQELGKACSIEVGAAAAAVLKSDASGR